MKGGEGEGERGVRRVRPWHVVREYELVARAVFPYPSSPSGSLCLTATTEPSTASYLTPRSAQPQNWQSSSMSFISP